MIARLTGKVTATQKNPLIVDVHDVGYAVYVPEKILTKSYMDEPITFFIHTHVRDDALQLFGFLSIDELSMFEMLITVSGIGPKTALLVIDRGVKAIQKAITTGDVEFFTTIPRLGKKNAQKIIIELKNKLGGLNDLDLSGNSSETKEIFDALLSMGFDKNEIKDTLSTIPEGSVEEKIKYALKQLGK
jgi:holliday junction DNA helicase RuvA